MRSTTRKRRAMSGTKLLVDTNVFIRLFEGDADVAEYLQEKHLFVSIITEMELLGFHGISEPDKRFYQTVLNDCSLLELSQPIKERTISLKQHFKIRLPAAIIAATADYLGNKQKINWQILLCIMRRTRRVHIFIELQYCASVRPLRRPGPWGSYNVAQSIFYKYQNPTGSLADVNLEIPSYFLIIP